MALKPDKANILGIEHTIAYVDNPADVDLFKRESLWGQYDPWTRTIRVYDNGKPTGDIWETIIHEVIESLVGQLHIESLQGKENHDDLDLLALALTDTLIRNGWLEVDDASRV